MYVCVVVHTTDCLINEALCFHSIQLACLFEGHWEECLCQYISFFIGLLSDKSKNNLPTNRLSK